MNPTLPTPPSTIGPTEDPSSQLNQKRKRTPNDGADAERIEDRIERRVDARNEATLKRAQLVADQAADIKRRNAEFKRLEKAQKKAKIAKEVEEARLLRGDVRTSAPNDLEQSTEIRKRARITPATKYAQSALDHARLAEEQLRKHHAYMAEKKADLLPRNCAILHAQGNTGSSEDRLARSKVDTEAATAAVNEQKRLEDLANMERMKRTREAAANREMAEVLEVKEREKNFRIQKAAREEWVRDCVERGGTPANRRPAASLGVRTGVQGPRKPMVFDDSDQTPIRSRLAEDFVAPPGHLDERYPPKVSAATIRQCVREYNEELERLSDLGPCGVCGRSIPKSEIETVPLDDDRLAAFSYKFCNCAVHDSTLR